MDEPLKRYAKDFCPETRVVTNQIYMQSLDRILELENEIDTLKRNLDDPIEFEGEFYHARDGKILHDPYDNKAIPVTSCICAAHSAGECCCGAWDILE